MRTADSNVYLQDVVAELMKTWPDNRAVNLVCHGHSVPAGYFATPLVDTFGAYPHLLHRKLKERFPFAVLNVIVTAIGGENSLSGSERFGRDVASLRPDVITVDYGLNDVYIGLEEAQDSWRRMIEAGIGAGSKIILLTPTWDNSAFRPGQSERWEQLQRHAEQIRALAAEYEVGLADSFAAFQAYVDAGGHAGDLLSWSNHPNQSGHELVAARLARWFVV